jgi:hypothetical protein
MGLAKSLFAEFRTESRQRLSPHLLPPQTPHAKTSTRLAGSVCRSQLLVKEAFGKFLAVFFYIYNKKN